MQNTRVHYLLPQLSTSRRVNAAGAAVRLECGTPAIVGEVQVLCSPPNKRSLIAVPERLGSCTVHCYERTRTKSLDRRKVPIVATHRAGLAIPPLRRVSEHKDVIWRGEPAPGASLHTVGSGGLARRGAGHSALVSRANNMESERRRVAGLCRKQCGRETGVRGLRSPPRSAA